MRQLVNALRQLEKFQTLKQSDPESAEVREQVEKKIPLFEKALVKLRERKRKLAFDPKLEGFRSPGHKGDLTFVVNSSVKEYSLCNNETFQNTRADDRSAKNAQSIQDSFANSVKTLFDSIKTDNFSKKSDKSLFRELKQSSLVNDEKLINEKLAQFEKKLESLRY